MQKTLLIAFNSGNFDCLMQYLAEKRNISYAERLPNCVALHAAQSPAHPYCNEKTPGSAGHADVISCAGYD